MSTVYLAIANIVKSNGLEDSVCLMRPWPAYIGNDPEVEDRRRRDLAFPEFQYNNLELLRDEPEPDAIVYWGDFQHGHDFQVQSAKRARRVFERLGRHRDEIDYPELVKRYFLLSDHFRRNELPAKLAMYGGTLFQNGLRELNDSEYLDNLRWLYRNASYAKVRDPFSANLLAFLTQDFETSHLGVDPALLNRKEELLELPGGSNRFETASRDNIAIYFGRSSRALPRLGLLLFLKSLARRLGGELVELPWGHFGPGLFRTPLGWIEPLLGAGSSSPDRKMTAGDLFRGMSRARLIVTDTYHVCVNAAVLGVPAVCIYEPSPRKRRDANMGYRRAWRDKRVLHFLSSMLSDFLVSSGDLESRRTRREKAENIAGLVEQQGHRLAYDHLAGIGGSQRAEIAELLAGF